MRKSIMALGIFVLVALVGCTSSTSTTTGTTTSTSTTTTSSISTTETYEVVDDSNYISLLNTFSIVDEATDYDFNAQTLSLYKDIRNVSIPYVDVTEFLALVAPGLLPFELEVFETAVVTIPYTDDFTYTLTINPHTNTLTFNDFSFITAISSSGNSVYESNVQLIDYQVEGSSSLSIDLDDYQLDCLYTSDGIFLPFDVANYVLTGYSINLYRKGESIYLFDDLTNMGSVLNESMGMSPISQTDMVDYTNRIAALFFDYFYGLTSDNKANTFHDNFDELDETTRTSIPRYDEKFQRFIYSIDDLHTTIYDYGYNRTIVSTSIEPSPYSRTVLYYNEFVNSCLFVSDAGPFYFYDQGDYYILKINQFDLDTKDLLAEALNDIDPEKDIFIDLSCNGGGAIVGVLELLSYMTNEPIVLSYMNGTTKAIYQETYQAETPRALSNRFVVLASRVTFSAANLFVSLVQDMDLAMVIGTKTTGGAAAVTYGVFPNNLIMSYSSNIVFLNQELESIEMGITPDYEFAHRVSNLEAVEKYYSFFRSEATYLLSNQSSFEAVDIRLSNLITPSDFQVHGFTIEVYDAFNDRIIESFDITGSSFSIQEFITDTTRLIELSVHCHYSYHNIDASEVIYHDYIDELPDRLSDPAYELPIDELYETTKSDLYDVDIVQIVITEADMYRLLINGLYSYDYAGNLYNDQGEFIEKNNDFYLVPGTYFLELNLDEIEFDYTVLVQCLNDDTILGTPLLVEEGHQSLTLNFDYVGDNEWIEFTVPEEMFVTFSGTYSVAISYKITDQYDRPYLSTDSTLLLNQPKTILLPKGDYHLKFTTAINPRIMTLSIDSTIAVGDIPGDVLLDSENYGVLTPGTLNLTFEGLWDRDVYVYETASDVIAYFTNTSKIRMGIIIDGTIQTKGIDEPYFLTAGTHYFIFIVNTTTIPYMTPIDFVVVEDQSNESTMIPITFGTPFTTVIEQDNDIDYFTFHVDSLTHFSLTSVDSLSSTVQILTSSGDLLYMKDGGKFNFQLDEGDYVFKVYENISELNRVLTFQFTITPFESDDMDPNLPYLSDSYYRHFIGEVSLLNQVNGIIDYKNDFDFVIFEVTEVGSYEFYFSGNATAYLMDSSNNATRLRDDWEYDLTVGIYYVYFYSDYSDPVTYRWAFMKVD